MTLTGNIRMIDGRKSKKQLIEELEELRREVRQLKNNSSDQSSSDLSGCESTQKRLSRQIEGLQKVSELSLTAADDTDCILNRLVEIIGELLNVKVVCLSEIRGDKLFFKVVYTDGDMSANVGHCPLSVTPCATVEKSKDLRIYNNVVDMFPEATFLKEKSAYSYCGFPSLGSDGNVIAVTSLLDSKEHAFSDSDKGLLRILGQHIAVEFERQKHLSKRKQTEEALRESENKYRTLFEKSADAILIIEGDRFVDCNSATVEMLGYKNKKELLETHPSELSPEMQPDGKSSFVKANEMISIAFSRGSHRFEWDHIRQNGQVFPVEVLLTAVPSRGKNFLHVVWRDITERKRLEELESRAARLDTAGTIAGQVAHDFNNLLGPLVAYPEFIREELPGDHPGLKYLEDIEKSAIKIAEINQQLLSLGRRGHYNQEALNLNRVVSQALKEMVPLADNVTCITDLDENLFNILGGGAQIHRVVTNLLCNAVDALQNGGNISVKTENYYADEVSGVYGRVPRGEYVKLTVSDTGCGISDEIVQKILDPFFTTKTSDKIRGSGLGLSVVDAVVKDHGGYLDLETRFGRGTSFYLYFPATRKSHDDNRSDLIVGGAEKVLVIDDDETQRNVATKLLRKLGYEVCAVESGEMAVEFLNENPQDLLVLDMVMPPGIDGAETYRRILVDHPAQKAILASGFSETERVHQAQALGAGAFVKKPLTKRSIAAAVREELDRPVRVTV